MRHAHGLGSSSCPPRLRTFFVRLLCFAVAILHFASCSNTDVPQYQPQYDLSDADNGTQYIFAPHPRLNPQKTAEVYGAIVAVINERLAAEHIVLKLEASRDYTAFNEKLLTRQPHFALPNPYQTVLSLDCGYNIFGKMDHDEDFRGIILMSKDSPITTVKGLKGSTLAFPAPTALAATLMPELFLSEHGIDPRKDITQLFVGTHESVIMNLSNGFVSAACTSPLAWANFQKDRPELAKRLKVRWQTTSLPNNGLVVRDDVPEHVQRLVAQAFFQLNDTPEGRLILQKGTTFGFVPADNSTFAGVYDFIRHYEKAVRPLRGLHE